MTTFFLIGIIVAFACESKLEFKGLTVLVLEMMVTNQTLAIEARPILVSRPS